MSGLTIRLQRLLLFIWCFTITWTPTVSAGTARILIFSATNGFRHDSIPHATDVLKQSGHLIDATFDSTEQPSDFTDSNLANYDALVFLMTTGNVLPDDTAFQRYINSGGNFVGIHSASDTLRTSNVYLRELGSRFENHPSALSFDVINLEPTHPTVSMLPNPWHIVQDEPYNFETDPRDLGAKVVLAADENTYKNVPHNGNQGTPHPLAWCQEKGAGFQSGDIAGRSFYTALGHTAEMWDDPLFAGHVLAGIKWVLQSGTTRAVNSSGHVGNPGTSNAKPSTLIDDPPTTSVKP